MRVTVLAFLFLILTPTTLSRPEATPDAEAFPDPRPVPDPDIKHIFDAIRNKQNPDLVQETPTNQRVIDITKEASSLNGLAVGQKALNILDEINAQPLDERGQKCVRKIMTRRETEYEEVMTCNHSYDERCHTSYTTNYEPHQEEECEERFRKVCMISYEQQAVTEMVEECTTPLVPDCEDTGPEVCRTVYDTVCDTRREEYEVEEQFPACQTVNMEKCKDVTTGLKTEEKCEYWPIQQCTVETKTVSHSNPKTECRKEPRQLCTPGDCALVEGPVLCDNKMKTVVVDNPVETCDLEPQVTCKQITKLVPQLTPRQECVQVPKEVCAMSRLNPTIREVPYVQNWCFDPDSVTLPQPSNCPEGWSEFNSYCYKVEETEKSFKGARDHCRTELQADLASIHSEAENNFIYNLIRSSSEMHWIGLNEQPGENDSFEWTDRSLYSYSSWTAQTPNPGMECAAMLSREPKWAKQLCGENKKFVCKKNI